ncbi:MAG TPA: hypothetical protein VMZ26_17220 [Pyrinomonadaceae bacterium]|nr:hypothetical protein [Pyrinomonadaceae bacterium]
MDKKGRAFILTLFVFAALLVTSQSLPTYAQSVKSPATKETKTEKLLKELKVSYEQFTSDHSFVTSYDGKELKRIDVILVEAETAVVVLADAAGGRDVELTPEKMRKLLEFNSKADYIKVGISDIGSVRVQCEQNLSLINAKVLEEILDQVASATDEVAKIIGPIKQKNIAK